MFQKPLSVGFGFGFRVSVVNGQDTIQVSRKDVLHAYFVQNPNERTEITGELSVGSGGGAFAVEAEVREKKSVGPFANSYVVPYANERFREMRTENSGRKERSVP